ncbi:adenylate/guanylate cyclase domain-containing protein [Fulvivirgaceae bacterium PWU4]|uniref:Adenylate/guanylate cyclase domain-containing protein n=1 Tax=Chryseosolibacter histidini TaxID=2782349 RepID=A0AAP2GSS0_9BACT|nr:adenylate/guanylate cyclase domain-containing protein [Chryseosolibacter histidini]MBT1701530.1 adenylate/guanylate cyclase domain-containing protein [Chryseosolibacter histidini]
MAGKFEYTTLAHRYTARYPVLTYVGTQANFWIIANVLLAVIFHFQSHLITVTYQVPVGGSFGPLALISVILGMLYGITLGLTGYYLDKYVSKKLALGKVILLRTLISLVVLMLDLALLRYVFFDRLIAPSMFIAGTTLVEEVWKSLFLLLVIYYAFMTLVISFINQVNKKYGPGILLPLLLGRYRKPREENRIFMFMDLKSSTTTAEQLGHLKYSAFIRDCFSDINEVLYPFYAQVYQYVGDEIVVTWPEREGLKGHSCLLFYFACRKQFMTRSDYYMSNYGLLPDFKAGAHTGTVTAVEIGEVKRDIAYHGDILNTAARIQSVCNEHQKSFIVSQHLLEKVNLPVNLRAQHLGSILLKGKASAVELVSVEE